MLKILLKKQLQETFRSFFYNSKTNEKRSTARTIVSIIFFAFLIIGVLGGMFSYLSITLCKSLLISNMDWLYFLLMSGISILIGIFGSVFNTHSSLYLSKDNDLLLSMPIPVKDIILSRLCNFYIMGSIYSLSAIIPAIIVYWCVGGITILKFFCDIMLILIISLIVCVLSCLLGWCVAKISLKIKYKSFVTVFASLVFIALYYFVYFKAEKLIADLIVNATIYGERIKGFSSVLYYFGEIGEGHLFSTLMFAGVISVFALAIWVILKKTFLSMVTSSGKTKKYARYNEKVIKQRGVFRALVKKEFSKFTSSPTYMLNCGLGIILIPVLGILILVKGNDLLLSIDSMFGECNQGSLIMICSAFCFLASMNDIAAPSVSLEGKKLWILQSCPIDPKNILRAKTITHLILTMIPIVFSLMCCLIIVQTDLYVKLMITLFVLSFVVFSAVFATFYSIKMPILSWTNEIIPIKQSGAVFISMFSCLGIAIIFAVLYFSICYKIGILIYLLIWTIIFTIATIILQIYLDNKGSKIFAKL